MEQLLKTDLAGVVPSLASPSSLEELCGFVAGTIPPLGHHPKPLFTLIDDSCRGEQVWLRGGGGRPGYSCVVQYSLLSALPNTVVRSFATDLS
jgi:prolyl-tRNA editing enzyme YbaK/EbsC (Cys-tRNA(Pro) deacylase)